MRTLFASALVLIACGCADRSSRPPEAESPLSIPAGPDPVVLRIPRGGGLVSAYAYPALDSAVWRSTQRAPALASLLGFDAEDGYLAAVDTAGRPVRLDLRLGAVAIPGSAGGSLHRSADGATLFAVNVEDAVARYTPAGDRWTITPTRTPDALIPLHDGSLVIVYRGPAAHELVRVRPPDTLPIDTLTIPIVVGSPPAPVASASTTGVAIGDRLFLAAGRQVVAIRTAEFTPDLDVDVEDAVRLMAPSPSGDRVFVAAGERPELLVVDRFKANIAARVRLPGTPVSLRLDPLGRFVLLQGPAESVWVVDVGTGTLVGQATSAWRADLPAVLADGVIALVQNEDVVLVNPATLTERRRVAGGASDTWYPMRWNGFRPRAEGLDAPVRFRTAGASSAASAGTLEGDAVPAGTAASRRDSADANRSVARTGGATADTAASADRPARRGPAQFTLQLAAVLSEEAARDAAAGVVVNGRTPRIVTSVREGRTLYRVVLGPFATRAEADSAGKGTGRSYWVYEGAP